MASRRVHRLKIRILIADREGVFRLGLKKLFALEDDLRVVAQADDGLQVPELARKFKPDVLLLQAEMVGEGGESLIAHVRRVCREGKVLITASTLAEDEALRYVKMGATGVILKCADPALFVKSVRKVNKGELCLPKGQLSPPAHGPRPHPIRPADTLTRREKGIIGCLVQGRRNREIAQHLDITEQTVKNHLRSIFDKVGVSDRLELALYAIHHRLELPPV